MKLVCHHGLEPIRQRVDVVHPARPPGQVINRDRVARVDHEADTENGTGDHGLVGRTRDARERAVETGHDEGGQVAGETEEEEATGLAAQVGHEVDEGVEDDHVERFVGDIGEVTCDGLAGLMVESVSVLFFNDWTFRVHEQYLVSC